MVKRGIGALVLAIIAALLLGYLLKDKSRERQEVVEMKLPGAPEMNIPNLTESLTESIKTGTASLIDEGKAKLEDGVESVKGAGSAIIASASGTSEKLDDNISKASVSSTTSEKPGFAIRPSLQNEEKEIVDTTNITPRIKEATQDESKKLDSASDNTVVASTSNAVKKVKKVFKPRIVEKKPASAPKAKAPQIIEESKTTHVIVSENPSGKYSIQLLATSSQSRAQKLSKTMKGEGYEVFITQTTKNEKILYRVRIGGHDERNAAIKAQEGMKRRYHKNFFVQNSLVVSD